MNDLSKKRVRYYELLMLRQLPLQQVKFAVVSFLYAFDVDSSFEVKIRICRPLRTHSFQFTLWGGRPLLS